VLSLAHLINPFVADPRSDLHLAQPVSFESMRIARETAKGHLKVELLSAQFPEDHAAVPAGFRPTPDLDRSVLDFGEFRKPRKYPLIRDLLDRLYENSEAEYLIFTNVDIGLQPHFYLAVKALIESGHDAFIINRRRIPAKFHSVSDLPNMWAEPGRSHPGFDCFVFHRDLYPKFHLAEVCLGVPFIGITLAQNLFCYAQNFRLIDRDRLSFHIGMELFKKRAPREYFVYNRSAFRKAISRMWPDLDIRKFPYYQLPLPFRIIRWGLHPSIPIRLALQLEWRRIKGA
jgi:hypothetical protein